MGQKSHYDGPQAQVAFTCNIKQHKRIFVINGGVGRKLDFSDFSDLVVGDILDVGPRPDLMASFRLESL